MKAVRYVSSGFADLFHNIVSGCRNCCSSIARLPRKFKVQKFRRERSSRMRRDSGSFHSYFDRDILVVDEPGRIRRAVNTINSFRQARAAENETYADKALKTPANFINWLFRFCFIFSFLTLGAFIGQHIGCLMEKGDKCNEDVATLLERKVGSIAAWAMGVVFSAVLDLVANKIWKCFSKRVDACLECFQTWAKGAKYRVTFFLGAFYGIMTSISGVLGFLAERYGEGKIWPKNSGINSAMVGFGIGVVCGVVGSVLILIKPLFKNFSLKKYACCTPICNCIAKINECMQTIGALFSRSAIPDRAAIAERNREEDGADDDLGLEIPLRDDDGEELKGVGPEVIRGTALPIGARVGFAIVSPRAGEAASGTARDLDDIENQDGKGGGAYVAHIGADAPSGSTYWQDRVIGGRELLSLEIKIG